MNSAPKEVKTMSSQKTVSSRPAHARVSVLPMYGDVSLRGLREAGVHSCLEPFIDFDPIHEDPMAPEPASCRTLRRPSRLREICRQMIKTAGSYGFSIQEILVELLGRKRGAQ